MRFSLFLGVLIFLSSLSQAHAEGSLKLNYAIYGSGLHAANGILTLTEKGDQYRAVVETGTQGFLAKVAPWSATVISEGTRKKDHWVPHRFTNKAIWRTDAKTTTMVYDAKGVPVKRLVEEMGRPTDTRDADPALAQGAVDLPTGILNFFRHRNVEDGCTGSFEVYDGKRRFTVISANQLPEVMERTRFNIYKGPALSCTIEIKPNGGQWSRENRGWFKIQEDSRKQGGLPRITVAPLEGIGDWLIPVRLDLDSPYGKFVMHLTGAQGSVN